jgi:hypothetical protein
VSSPVSEHGSGVQPPPENKAEYLNARGDREIEYCQSRCDKAEQESERFKRENRQLQVRVLNPDVGSVLCKENARLRDHIDALSKSLSALGFSKANKESFPPYHHKVNIKMEQIRTKLRGLLPDVDADFIFDTTTEIGNDDLQKLFRRSLALGGSLPTNKTTFSGMKLSLILQAVVSAAICEWVYEADVKKKTTGYVRRLCVY